MASGIPALPIHGRRVLGCPVALTGNAVAVRVQLVRITGVSPEDGLGLGLARKGIAVEGVALAEEVGWVE